MKLLKYFFSINKKLSRYFDKVFIANRFKIDGLREFTTTTLPSMLKEDSVVYDIGGGKYPYVGTFVQKKKDMIVVGIDIELAELKSAPNNIYDYIISADIGKSDLAIKAPSATLLICNSVLEHVQDTKSAISNISKITESGGMIALYIPCKNATFAVLNRVIPERVKNKLLYTIFPDSQTHQGFPAFYNNCTPKDMVLLCRKYGFKKIKIAAFYQVYYFTFFVPLHILWRIYQLITYPLCGNNLCESFIVTGVKE